MIKDIKFIHKDKKLLTGELSITNVSSTTITVSGETLESNNFVNEIVRINDNIIGKIISNSSNTITVQSWDGGTPSIGDKCVIEDKDYLNKYKIYYSFENKVISGKDKLIQDIVKRILTKLGSNAFVSTFGSQFIEDATKRSYSDLDIENFKSSVLFSLEKIKLDIQKIQNEYIILGNELLDSEILEDLSILNLKYDKIKSIWKFELLIVTKNGSFKIEV